MKKTFQGLKITNCYYIIHLYDSDFQPFIDLTKPDEQKEENNLNSNLIKASPIVKQKNLTEKDNQNETLETSFESQNHKGS